VTGPANVYTGIITIRSRGLWKDRSYGYQKEKGEKRKQPTFDFFYFHKGISNYLFSVNGQGFKNPFSKNFKYPK
jgi:hypothetical protein